MTQPTPMTPGPKPPVADVKPADEKAGVSSTADMPAGEKAAAQMVEGVALDHGDETDTAKEQKDAAKKAEKDPYGTTPMQSRDLKEEDAPSGRTVLVDGLNPHIQEFPEGEGVSGGTLPPV